MICCVAYQGELRSPACWQIIEGTHEVGGKPGAISFGYFSWQDKKSNWLPGNPPAVLLLKVQSELAN